MQPICRDDGDMLLGAVVDEVCSAAGKVLGCVGRQGSNARLSCAISVIPWTSHWPGLQLSLHSKRLEMSSVVSSLSDQGGCCRIEQGRAHGAKKLPGLQGAHSVGSIRTQHRTRYLHEQPLHTGLCVSFLLEDPLIARNL